MMDARDFLIPAVHEVAVAAGTTVPAAAAEKAYADALADLPAFHTGADHINAPHRLMTRNARQFDRKKPFDSEGIGMTDPARLNANADMAGVRVPQWLLCQFEFARADHMYSAICRSGLHHRNLYFCETWNIRYVLYRGHAGTNVLTRATADLLSQKSCYSSHGRIAVSRACERAMRPYVVGVLEVLL
jgi:hypothetical protein